MRERVVVALLIGLIAGIPSTVRAQAGTGTMRVQVVADDQWIEGAAISAGGISGTTDAKGIATLTLPAGSVSIAATKDGYEPATVRAAVVAGQERRALIRLTATSPEGRMLATTRTGRRVDDQATPVGLVGRDQIDQQMLARPGDITTLFNETPGVRPQITSTALGTTIFRIRGLPGQYTRLLSDGVALFWDRPGGYAPVRIPPMDIDRIELLKEPASGLFGPDAIGVINLLSRRPGNAPHGEFLFNQSTSGATDGVMLISLPPKNSSWSSAWLVSAHRQREKDTDDDGWSDLPGSSRGVIGPRVYWDNGRGRRVDSVANVTFETREGGSDFARESLETKTADGSMSGQMLLRNGMILGGAGFMYVQSRQRHFSDAVETDRLQAAVLELTLRRPSARHTWLGGIAADWYALRRTGDPLPTTYVSTGPSIFVHDDFRVAPWLLVSGSLRVDEHAVYRIQVSPRGSALVIRGPWTARVTAAQGYFWPHALMEETEAAGLARLTIAESLEKETARTVSADFSRRTPTAAFTISIFRTQVDDPAQVDRTTYTLRTEADPLVAIGAELSGSVRRGPFSAIGAYTWLDTRERDGRAIALNPRHRASAVAMASAPRGRLGIELSYTGEQRLDANPYRTTSESYVLFRLFGEYRFGRWGVFVNGDNLTDVRQTNWDPIQRPSRDVDGRWTVDAWAPLTGRGLNAGLKVAF